MGAAIGMAAFTAIGTAATRATDAGAQVVSGHGFAAAFTAAALVSLTTAALGATLRAGAAGAR